MAYKDTELRLGLPGAEDKTDLDVSCVTSKKRSFQSKNNESAPPTKTQIVGWPPVRSYRKKEVESAGIYVKVSMDGAPYLRKIDLKIYKDYNNLLNALENMFKFTIGEYSEREGYKGCGYVPTYEDKDGDWMLVGDVPWDMFSSSCKRLRIMKGSEARGLGCDV